MATASTHQIPTGYGPRTRPYFDGTPESYAIWETRFTSYLYTLDKGLQKAILQPSDDVDDDRDFATKNKWAYAELVQVLDERSLQLIMSDAPNDGRNALKILQQHYASTETPRVLKLYEELTTLRMTSDEDVTDYLIRAERAATGLRAANENITNNLIIAMLLKGLPDDYKSFVVVHTQMEQTKTLTEFKAALRCYANTESSRSSLQHTAMTTKKQNTFANVKGGQCLSCGIRGHISRNCRSKSKLQCTYCHKPGHVESVCFTKKRNTGNSNKVTPTDHHATATFFTASEQSVINNKQNNFNILVDCGATCHILNDANLFTSYDNTFDPKRHVIEVADGRRSSEIAVARGSGKVTLVDSHGNTATVILKDALLAPKFPTSLFSVPAATDSGARIIFRKGAAELTIQNTRFKFIQRGHLYFLPTASTHQIPTSVKFALLQLALFDFFVITSFASTGQVLFCLVL